MRREGDVCAINRRAGVTAV